MEKVKPCEICNMTYDGTNLHLAMHTICDICKKKLRLLKDKTIQSYDEEGCKEERIYLLRRMIRIEYILERIQELKKKQKV